MVHVFFKCMLKNGPVNKVCDIYRLQDGQLTEHWGIIEHNVEGVQSRNDNGLSNPPRKPTKLVLLP